jgi:acyl-CoA reductase-like NAD-dependent aldehyde dehydrogenase
LEVQMLEQQPTTTRTTPATGASPPEMLASLNPATGAVITEVPVADAAAVRAAVALARAAQPAWAARPLTERAAYLRAFRDQVLGQADDLSHLIAQEQGRPAVETLATEIFPVAEVITYYTSHAARFLSDQPIKLGLMRHRRSYIHYAPLGVIGIIAPWNFPFVLPLSEAVPALLAGNTVVLKPSELTPLIAQRSAAIFASVNLPEHVFQVVQGSGPTGAALVNAGVDKVVFTGGGNTAKRILATAAETLTPVVCELGGKDPMIICADAAIERAAQAAVWGAFANAGQICASVERVYVAAPIADAFIARVVALTRSLRVGRADGTQQVDVGPMISERQLAIVERHIADATERGAKVLTGGRRPAGLTGPFYLPTVLTDVTPDMVIMREETFGPVMPITVVGDDEEAICLANDLPFGLDAYVFSRDRKHAEAIARRLEAGTVMINDLIASYAAPETPWGGVKQSGIGRVHGGAQGIREFCQERHIMAERASLKRELWWFPYRRSTQTLLRTGMRLLYRVRK